MSVKCVCPCVLLLGIWLVGGSIQLFLLIPQWKKKVNWMSWYTNLCYFWWFGTKNSTVSHDASLIKCPFGEINNWKTSNTRQEAPAGLCDFGNCWSLKGELGRKWKFSHRPLTPVQWQNMDSNLVKPKFAKVKVKCSEKFRHEVFDYGYGLGKRERRVVALLSWEEKYCTHHMLHHLENENPAVKRTTKEPPKLACVTLVGGLRSAFWSPPVDDIKWNEYNSSD